MTVTIETGIPMPASYPQKARFPLADLKVGESFVVDLEGHNSWAFIYAAIEKAKNKTGFKFTSRLLADGRRRVWRHA